jgi:hypothetical protein
MAFRNIKMDVFKKRKQGWQLDIICFALVSVESCVERRDLVSRNYRNKITKCSPLGRFLDASKRPT